MSLICRSILTVRVIDLFALFLGVTMLFGVWMVCDFLSEFLVISEGSLPLDSELLKVI